MLNIHQLYELGKTVNIDIFGGISVPNDCSALDASILKSVCYEHCGLNIPIYPDPKTFAAAVTLWSQKNQYTFKHIDNIMVAKYSPIENVFEDTIRKFDGDTKTDDKNDTTYKNHNKRTLDEDLKNDKTDLTHGKVATESGSDDNNTTNTVSAYDSANYQPDNKSENKITYGHKVTDSGTDSTTRNYHKDNDSENNGDGENHLTIDGHEVKKDQETTSRHGNIGITSANKLQIEEYNMLAEFNPYTFIAELFETELTLYVY